MIKLDNISKKFDQRGIAGVNRINLTLASGEIHAILGPNGSGKTTLLRLILGELKSESGSVTHEGRIALFKPLTVGMKGNVQRWLMDQVRSIEVEEEKRLQLARDFADIFEFTFQLRQDLSELSQGQMQKVALAAALIDRPQTLLLDEPFAHLDPHTRGEILRYLFEYIRMQQLSVIWVTHDIEEALRFSDRLSLLNFGQIIQTGTPREFIREPKNLFVAQFMGFQNFLAVKKETDGFMTPWGAMKATIDYQEGYLVLPREAINLCSGPEGQAAKVKDVLWNSIRPTLVVELAEKKLYLDLPRSAPILQPQDLIYLQASLADCFLIPL
jgi:iron(III) transport system ATP-binding protein